jgi:hypothetical protein
MLFTCKLAHMAPPLLQGVMCAIPFIALIVSPLIRFDFAQAAVDFCAYSTLFALLMVLFHKRSSWVTKLTEPLFARRVVNRHFDGEKTFIFCPVTKQTRDYRITILCYLALAVPLEFLQEGGPPIPISARSADRLRREHGFVPGIQEEVLWLQQRVHGRVRASAPTLCSASARAFALNLHCELHIRLRPVIQLYSGCGYCRTMMSGHVLPGG